MESFQISNLLTILANLLPRLAILIGSIAAIGFLIRFVRRILAQAHLYKQDAIYLELTPPANIDRLPQATQQLFSAIHGLGMSRRWIDHLLGRETCFALEIVSTRKQGIRFILRIPEDKAAILEQLATSYIPDMKLKRTTGYFAGDESKHARVISFRQTRHFAFPLTDHEILSQHDPIGYITNSMTQLEAGELMAYQLVIQPTHISEADSLSSRILSNEDLLARIDKKRSGFPTIVFSAINSVLFGILDVIGGAYHGPSRQQYNSAQKELDYKKQVAKGIRPVRTLSYFEHELVESIHQKLAQPLFKVEIRAIVSCHTNHEAKQRRQSLTSAMSLFTVPKYQDLRARRQQFAWFNSFQLWKFMYRLPALFKSSAILSVSELAGLYHFPHSVSGKTENVVKSLSKTLPAPISLKADPKLDLILGKNVHHGSTTPIGLTAAERERHIYIIGGTGNGKTTMLMYGLVQDMKAGKGIAVIDPHGDLAKTLLEHVPPERLKDVIYFDPDDVDFPIGVNLLELPAHLTGSDLEREKDRITESVISVFRKIFSEDDSGGHRIEYVLRNAIQTALTLENPTIFTVFELLTNDEYRKKVTNALPPGTLKNFWKNELGKAGNMQRVKMSQGVTSKIGRFEFSIHTKRVMGQAKSTIDFDDILQNGKILICNFSKGRLGEEASALFGTATLAKLQVAANRRDIIAQAERTPFYLYVDEFQNFATMPFVQMLSEARKYRLFLTMAEQSTAQQEELRMVNIILANVGTVICFRTGSPADERLVLPLFKPFIEEGEIANLPSFNFYIRIAALQPQEPMSGETLLLEEDGDQTRAQKAMTSSRQRYAKEFKEESKSNTVEKQIQSQPKKHTSKQDEPEPLPA